MALLNILSEQAIVIENSQTSYCAGCTPLKRKRRFYIASKYNTILTKKCLNPHIHFTLLQELDQWMFYKAIYVPFFFNLFISICKSHTYRLFAWHNVSPHSRDGRHTCSQWGRCSSVHWCRGMENNDLVLEGIHGWVTRHEVSDVHMLYCGWCLEITRITLTDQTCWQKEMEMCITFI